MDTDYGGDFDAGGGDFDAGESFDSSDTSFDAPETSFDYSNDTSDVGDGLDADGSAEISGSDGLEADLAADTTMNTSSDISQAGMETQTDDFTAEQDTTQEAAESTEVDGDLFPAQADSPGDDNQQISSEADAEAADTGEADTSPDESENGVAASSDLEGNLDADISDNEADLGQETDTSLAGDENVQDSYPVADDTGELDADIDLDGADEMDSEVEETASPDDADETVPDADGNSDSETDEENDNDDLGLEVTSDINLDADINIDQGSKTDSDSGDNDENETSDPDFNGDNLTEAAENDSEAGGQDASPEADVSTNGNGQAQNASSANSNPDDEPADGELDSNTDTGQANPDSDNGDGRDATEQENSNPEAETDPENQTNRDGNAGNQNEDDLQPDDGNANETDQDHATPNEEARAGAKTDSDGDVDNPKINAADDPSGNRADTDSPRDPGSPDDDLSVGHTDDLDGANGQDGKTGFPPGEVDPDGKENSAGLEDDPAGKDQTGTSLDKDDHTGPVSTDENRRSAGTDDPMPKGKTNDNEANPPVRTEADGFTDRSMPIEQNPNALENNQPGDKDDLTTGAADKTLLAEEDHNPKSAQPGSADATRADADDLKTGQPAAGDGHTKNQVAEGDSGKKSLADGNLVETEQHQVRDGNDKTLDSQELDLNREALAPGQKDLDQQIVFIPAYPGEKLDKHKTTTLGYDPTLRITQPDSPEKKNKDKVVQLEASAGGPPGGGNPPGGSNPPGGNNPPGGSGPPIKPPKDSSNAAQYTLPIVMDPPVPALVPVEVPVQETDESSTEIPVPVVAGQLSFYDSQIKVSNPATTVSSDELLITEVDKNDDLFPDQDTDVDASEKNNIDLMVPGPYAVESIPARYSGPIFIPEEREKIDSIGYSFGCHSCGTLDPGTKSGHFVPDHQPPTALNPDNLPQELYPQCLGCSNKQGGLVRSILSK